MVEETKKKAAPKKAAAPKAEKPVAKKAAQPAAKAPVAKAAKPVAEKFVKTGATIKVVQIGSPIGRTQDQRGTLVGLGLGKLHRERVLEDTPMVRGMINHVKHLVKVVESK